MSQIPWLRWSCEEVQRSLSNSPSTIPVRIQQLRWPLVQWSPSGRCLHFSSSSDNKFAPGGRSPHPVRPDILSGSQSNTTLTDTICKLCCQPPSSSIPCAVTVSLLFGLSQRMCMTQKEKREGGEESVGEGERHTETGGDSQKKSDMDTEWHRETEITRDQKKHLVRDKQWRCARQRRKTYHNSQNDQEDPIHSWSTLKNETSFAHSPWLTREPRG